MVEMRTFNRLTGSFVPSRLNLERLPLPPGFNFLMHSRTLPGPALPVDFFVYYESIKREPKRLYVKIGVYYEYILVLKRI